MIMKKESCDPEQATTGYQQRREAQSLQSPAVPPPKLHAHVPGAGFCDFSSMISWSWYRWQGKIVNDNNTIKMKCQQIFWEIVKQHLWLKAVAFHSRPQAGAVAAGFPSWAFLAQPRLGHNLSVPSLSTKSRSYKKGNSEFSHSSLFKTWCNDAPQQTTSGKIGDGIKS